VLCCCRYQEKFYFNPGDTGFKVWDTKFGRIGAAICWDQWFPETARCLALLGAEVRLLECRCSSLVPQQPNMTGWCALISAQNRLPWESSDVGCRQPCVFVE
jgi:hypothetical protein